MGEYLNDNNLYVLKSHTRKFISDIKKQFPDTFMGEEHLQD